MKNIISIVEELQADSSRLGKEAILKRESDNEEFKQFMKYVVDPSLVYGIQKKKLDKMFKSSLSETVLHTNVFDLFKYLLDNNTGSDAVVNNVASFIMQQPDEQRDFLIEAITKKLRTGVSIKTLAKVYPDLIELFEVQRAKSYSDYKEKLTKSKKPYSLYEKMNGIRCITIKRGNIILNKTRQNKLIFGLNEINKDLLDKPDGVYEGELVIKEYEKLKLRDVLQKTMKIVNSDEENKIVDYWMFDYLPEEEFNAGKSKKNYFERYDTHPINGASLQHVKMIPELYRGTDESIIEEVLNKYVDELGREGLMRYEDKPYEAKRTANILKVKKKYTSDLRVTGFEEGKGKYKGMLGALILDYKGFELGCSGMTDVMRVEIWENKDKYLGAIAEIEHEQESSNESGGISLEYPTFQYWRFDKDEVNYAHETRDKD